MNIQELAKKLAIQNKTYHAEKYDLYLREYDNMVELLGLVSDPTYDMKDFVGKEMLFPKKWVTLKTFDSNYRIQL
jgi:hypothetical protein